MPKSLTSRTLPLLALIPALTVPLWLHDPVWMDIIVLIVIHYAAALGMMILFGYAGQISLAQAAFVGIGSYAPAMLAIRFELSPWLGLPVGLLLAGAVAVLIGVPVLRLQGLYLAMATAAFNVLFIVLVSNWDSMTGGGFGLSGIPALSFFGYDLVDPQHFYYVAVVLAIILFLLAEGLVKSPTGAMFSALSHNPRAAGLVGIPVPRLKVKAFVLSACFAAVAGFLLTQYMAVVVPESFAVPESIAFLLMVVVGGMRSPWGALAGAAFVTVMPQLMPQSPQGQEILYAVAFMVILMFMPKGITGLNPRRVVRRLAARRTGTEAI